MIKKTQLDTNPSLTLAETLINLSRYLESNQKSFSCDQMPAQTEKNHWNTSSQKYLLDLVALRNIYWGKNIKIGKKLRR